jgi:hypothetical protein
MAVPVEATRPAAPKAVSHGICRPCLDHQLAALDFPVIARGAWSTRPSLAQASAGG